MLRRQGYAATGLNEIVALSGAPRGSLYFHFPAGKEELAAAAMTRSGEALREGMRALLWSSDDLAVALGRLIDSLAAGLESSGYADGCPIATVALEASHTSERVRVSAAAVFDSWLEALQDRIVASGVEEERAGRRALLVLSAVEGALILARARRGLAPLAAVREELIELLA